jgi:hypothetical protein
MHKTAHTDRRNFSKSWLNFSTERIEGTIYLENYRINLPRTFITQEQQWIIFFVNSIRSSSTSTSIQWPYSPYRALDPVINGLSDHDAQYLMINNIAAAGDLIPLKQRTRKVNNETIMQFQLLLKSETWESVYKDNDTNNK